MGTHLRYAQDMPEIYIRFDRDRPAIMCMVPLRHKLGISEICPRFTRVVPEICMKFVRDMPRVYLIKVCDSLKIF